MSTIYFFTECADCDGAFRARDWKIVRDWTVRHKDTTGHCSFQENQAIIVSGLPRSFYPITDCPSCATVTAHIMAYAAADTDLQLVEVLQFGKADPEYITNGRLEPVVARECLNCRRTWDEELPDEWRVELATT